MKVTDYPEGYALIPLPSYIAALAIVDAVKTRNPTLIKLALQHYEETPKTPHQVGWGMLA